MNRKSFFPILLGIFSAIIFFWLHYTFKYESNVNAGETTGTSYILHAICFFSAFVVFILMLVVLDITKEDYERNNKELNAIKVDKAKIRFEEWKVKRKVPWLKRLIMFFSLKEDNKNSQTDNTQQTESTQ